MDRDGDVDLAPASADAELLAGLRQRGRGPAWQLVLVVAFLALGAGQVTLGTRWVGITYLVIGVFHLWSWWVDPRARVRAVTVDSLVVRRGLRTQTVPRADVVDVHPRHDRRHGLEISVRDGQRIRLVGTAVKASVAEAQAAALRRWAGLDD